MLLSLLLLSVSAHAAIFGADDRYDVTPRTPFAELGRATAVAILSSNIEPSTTKLGTYKLNTDRLDALVCPGERFSSDPSLAYACSGFLVGPDLLVTAGHCMVNTGESRNETDTYCAAFGWLFDYQKSEDGRVALDSIPPENFYKCKRTVYAIREEVPPFRDYALVQLERPVAGRAPFGIAKDPVRPGELLSMIGYPFGTPMKASPYGRVTIDTEARPSFLTSLDAFEGNSGSVVFNREHEAVGILVGGTPSANTVPAPGRQCERYNRCDENGRNCLASDNDTSIFPGYQGVGSEVQRIAPIAELLRSLR